MSLLRLLFLADETPLDDVKGATIEPCVQTLPSNTDAVSRPRQGWRVIRFPLWVWVSELLVLARVLEWERVRVQEWVQEWVHMVPWVHMP